MTQDETFRELAHRLAEMQASFVSQSCAQAIPDYWGQALFTIIVVGVLALVVGVVWTVRYLESHHG
jgi:hypothetical protein